jgi:hypothetical protein
MVLKRVRGFSEILHFFIQVGFIVFSYLQQFEIKRGTKMVNFKDGKKRK